MKKEFEPNVKTALETMCEYANVSFDEVDWASDNWYALHSWTREQEKAYGEWWCKFVKKHWKGILTHKPYSNKQIATAWLWWNLNYGWKIKESNDD